MKAGFKSIGLALLCSVSVTCFSDTLSEVYQQALQNDPTFKKAEADWLTAKEEVPLAMTGNGTPGSGLFPNIAVGATFGKTYYPLNNINQSNIYGLTVTQPLFNLATWESISSANYAVKAATARYLAENQSLITRVTTAYFEVLRAKEQLTLTQAQKKEFKKEYQDTKARFEVGIIDSTGVYNALAKYDQSSAQEIKDRYALQNALANLRIMTGKNYTSLSKLNTKIPLVMPAPKNMNKWIGTALKQNYILQADLNQMLSSKKNITVATAGMAPSLDFVGSYQNGQTTFTRATPTSITNPEQTQVGLNLNFPIMRGGYDLVNTKQARYKYLSASDQLEIDHQQIMANTEKAYLGIISGIAQVKADQEAIQSAEKQLYSTEESYKIGTQTMTDVLNSITSLTQAKQQYANDRYNYVESLINLKQESGILAPSDVTQIQSWLGGKVILMDSL